MSGLVLEDKVALLTGAAGGMGSACGLAFARAGASLALVDRSASALEDVARRAEAISGVNQAVISLPADVSDARAVQSAVERAIQRFGRIDVLVNLAGPHPWCSRRARVRERRSGRWTRSPGARPWK